MQLNGKNPIREAVCQLHYATMKHFETVPSEEMRLSDLKGFLKITIPKISSKSEIQKILKKESASVVASAKSISVKGRFDKSKLMYDLYDGVLLTKDLPLDKKYDAIVLQTPSKIAAHMWYPNNDELFDDLEIKLEAENDFEKKCPTLIVKNPIKPSAKAAPSASPIKKAKQPPAFPVDNKNIIGKIRQSAKQDYRLNVNPEKDQIHGVVFEKYANSIRPNDILKIENDSADHYFIATINDIRAIPISAVGVTKQFSELSTQVVLKPMLEVAPGYKGKPRPGNIVGYHIKQPTDAELIEALHVPDEGLPLGYVDYNNSNHVFHYPLEPKDSLYQSMMIAGVQNKGKTNFVKLLIMALASMKEWNLEMKPAIIILDKEGEYTNFASSSQMSPGARKYLKENHISPITPVVYTLHDDESRADATLSLRALEPEDIVYLTPQLESKTENIFRLLTGRVKDYFDSNQIPLEITSFRDRLLQESNNSNLIHIAQRPAIARAILSPSLNLFDRKNKIPLIPGKLLEPGKISVINCQGLDRNKRRVVALYLQLMLDRFQMNSNSKVGVLLVIDEAEELFSQNPHKSEKEYVTRIVGKMEDIVNRGRKHNFGVILVTHAPGALAASVADLTNTKVAFGCSGAEKWARDYFGKENVAEISDLRTGKARIAVKIGNENQEHLNLRIRVPYVGNADNLPNGGEAQ